jgi:hypothetical protein
MNPVDQALSDMFGIAQAQAHANAVRAATHADRQYIKAATDRIAELERDNATKAKTIALRDQNIRDLESERDELVEVMFSIVEHKGIAGTAAHTAMRDVLKRLGYDRSDDARED